MKWARLIIPTIVLAVVLSGGIGFVGTTSAQQDVAVTEVNVTPSEPAPGERVTFTATIANLESSDESVEITDVYLRSSGRASDHTRVEDAGSIAAGSSMTLPLSTSFDQPGEKDLRLNVIARDSTGYQRVEYPVYLNVSRTDDVQLAIESDDVVAGEETSVNVTVANGGSSPISNIRLGLDGDGQVDNPRRVSGTIPAETDRTYTYEVRFPEAGTGTIEASLRYALDGGVTRSASETAEVTIDPAEATTEGRIRLASLETTGGNQITISGEAANVGTTDAQAVLLSIQDREGVTPVPPSGDYFVGTVEGSEFGTFELTAEVASTTDTVPVLIEWTVDDERRSEVVEVDVEAGGRSAVEERTPPNQAGESGPGGGGPLGALGGMGTGALVGILLVVIGIPGIGYYLWNRK